MGKPVAYQETFKLPVTGPEKSAHYNRMGKGFGVRVRGPGWGWGFAEVCEPYTWVGWWEISSKGQRLDWT